MTGSDRRVTARTVRRSDGEAVTEYVVDGIAYGSLDALEAALRDR